MREKASALGVPLDGIEVRDPATDPRRAAFEAEYVELRKHKGVTPEIARERVALPHYFAALAVRAGEAVGFVSGLNSETKPFLPAFEIIKMRPGFKRASSVFVMAWEDRVWFYADCSMNIAPDAETLAEIGRASAQSARAFGHEPRVAFLSFSTRDSAKDASIDRVKEAVALVRAAEPGLVVDGEVQFDAAILPEVARKKCPDSPLAGRSQRLRVPRPQLGEHRLQDHGAPRRREGDRAGLPGAEQAGERRLPRLLGAGLRGRRRDHGAAGDGDVGPRSPHRAWAIDTAATAAVSARRMRGPREAVRKPAARRRSASAGSKPPAGPTRSSRAAGGATGSRGEGGVARGLEQGYPLAVEGSREEAVESRGGQNARYDRPAALLGRPRRHPLPPLGPRPLEGGPGRGVGPIGDDRPDLGDAELRRLLDDELHAIALERRDGEDEAERRLGARRRAVAEAERHHAPRDVLEDGLELRARAVEDPDGGARPQPQHLAGVVGALLRQLEPGPRGRLRNVEARGAHEGVS